MLVVLYIYAYYTALSILYYTCLNVYTCVCIYMCMIVIGDESWLSIGCPLRYYTKRAVFRRYIEMARTITKEYNIPYIDTSAVLKAAVPWYWGMYNTIYYYYHLSEL